MIQPDEGHDLQCDEPGGARGDFKIGLTCCSCVAARIYDCTAAVTGKLTERLQRMARIHDGRPRAHVDGHSDRFRDLVLGSALLERRFGMEADAVVASDPDRNAKRDQFLGLTIERLGSRCRQGDGGKRLHHLRCVAAQVSELRSALLRALWPTGHRSLSTFPGPPLGSHDESAGRRRQA